MFSANIQSASGLAVPGVDDWRGTALRRGGGTRPTYNR